MWLGEPSRTQFDLNFSLWRIPVRVHPLFWLAGLLLGPRRADPPAIMIWMAAFFIGILCHELGHALVMRAQGVFSWITLYALGGVTYSDQRRPSGAWWQILILAAGPAAGFLLAAAVIGLIMASGHNIECVLGGPLGLRIRPADVIGNMRLSFFVDDLLFVTIAYGILNLLPVYPLDGGQIVRELFTLLFGRGGIHHSLMLSIIVAGSLAVAGAVIWQNLFLALFFAYFAYMSFVALTADRFF
jgi:membrane-associated protease RseP (regulator of RpoE activity)